MRNMSSKVRKLSSALLLSIFAAGLAAIPLMQGASASSPLNWSNLTVGEIIAHGTEIGTNKGHTVCSFDTVQIATTVTKGVSRTLDLRTDDNCNLVVYGKGESNTVGVLSPGNPGYYNYVWMYGYGGSSDKLTSVNGSAHYSVSGSTVTIASPYNENCWWHASTGWANTLCTPDSITWSGNPATSGGHGNFHWTTDYYHTLYNTESLSVSGSTVTLTCVDSYNGVIVFGWLPDCKLT
jgi:hypothetical protein